MTKRELFKRYTLFIISLFFSALGVAFTKRGELGVSPISSVANVLSYKFTFLSMGNWLIVWNCILIIGQIVILRRKFQPIQLLQVPLSFLFGYFTDFGMFLASFVPASLYIVRILLVIVGVIILGFGISLSVIANVIMNAGEAFVKAVSDTLHKSFGNVKIVFDVSCVVFSIILSLLFFDFTIVGTREGTLIAAFGTGIAVKAFSRILTKPACKLLTK
ncbi:MAG: YitT family protein [Clostridia bacterium]|nr:YitT family protein [Clostridia bacterium]